MAANDQKFLAPHWENRPALLALTSLRFFAAMEVVLAHTTARYPFPHYLEWLVSHSYEAVLFFFVLSGFVLTYAYVNAKGEMQTSPARFWFSRFSRIAPAYYVSLAIVTPFLLYGFFFAGIISTERLWTTIGAALTFLPSLFIPSVTAWNSPAWSLGVEVCLYATFPFLVSPCFRWSLRFTALTSLASLAAISGLRVALFQAGGAHASWIGIHYHFPAFYLPHFLLGIVACRWFLFESKLSDASCTVIFVGAVSSLTIIWAAKLDLANSDMLLAPLSAAMILGATRATAWPARLLARPIFVLLGDASYAIYILHWPLSLWWRQVERVIAMPAWFACGLYVAVVVAAALLVFLLIERPARGYLLGLIR